MSRIDVLLDPILETHMSEDSLRGLRAKQFHGQIAISSAKIAYSIYRELFHSARFQRLLDKGARVQRLLWASTSTKNPTYSDVKYVEALIGPDTVNTLPLETIENYREHGDPKPRLVDDLDKAEQCFQHLPAFNIDINRATQQLENEGVEKFKKAYDQLIATMKKTMSKTDLGGQK